MQRSKMVADPAESAKAAGLRYVSDSRPGIERKPWRAGFRYVGIDGLPMRDKDTLSRIKSLAVPPAWVDVWICPIANGHLQATGRDAKGRKQSRYHPRWREARDETKYERMLIFGAVLPKIREQVDNDLALPGLSRRKVLATIVRLMETTFIRVGNVEYARENKSFGLTTMRGRHVQVHGSTLRFAFRGKSGVQHAVDLNDRRIAKIVRQCQDLPGYELFQYLDDDGERHTIDSADVNDYLREIAKHDFTAKDFRTWAGTVLTSMMLREFEAFESESQAKKNILGAIKAVAARLGNTPSICRKCYVHPAVLESYLSGAVVKAVERRVERELAEQSFELRDEEAGVMRLLRRRLEQQPS